MLAPEPGDRLRKITWLKQFDFDVNSQAILDRIAFLEGLTDDEYDAHAWGEYEKQLKREDTRCP